MPTVNEVAKRLQAVARAREDSALAAIADGMAAFQRSLTLALGRQDAWGWADVAQVEAEVDAALRGSGLDGVADEFRVALEQYAAEAGALDVALSQGGADLLRAALDARTDGWQEVLGEARAWFRERLVTQTISPAPSTLLAEELESQLVGRMQAYADTYVNTALNDLQADTWKVFGASAGAEYWRYDGPDDDRRREVCEYLQEHGSDGREPGVWSVEDAEAVVDYPGMIGSAWANRGGWNCRHVWVPVLAE